MANGATRLAIAELSKPKTPKGKELKGALKSKMDNLQNVGKKKK